MKKLITIKEHSHEYLVSNCCGDHGNSVHLPSVKNYSDYLRKEGEFMDGPTYKDLSICHSCLEYCVYVTETEFETQIETPCQQS